MSKASTRQVTPKSPSKPALPDPAQLAKPAEAPARRPMTDAEVGLVEAYLNGNGPEIIAAQGAVLLERMNAGLAEVYVQARLAELEGMDARSRAWSQLMADLKVDGGKQITAVYEKLEEEARARRDARAGRCAPAGTPAKPEEFRDTQRAVAASGPFQNDFEDTVRNEELRRHRGDLGGPLFTDAEIAAQEALERSKQPTLSPPPKAADSGSTDAAGGPRY
jgi:hypothetical protein